MSLGNRQNFILYQNDRNSWSYVAGPGQIGDHVALISISGSPALGATLGDTVAQQGAPVLAGAVLVEVAPRSP